MVKLSHIVAFALILIVAAMLLFAVSQRIYGEMTGKYDHPATGEGQRQEVQTYTLW